MAKEERRVNKYFYSFKRENFLQQESLNWALPKIQMIGIE